MLNLFEMSTPSLLILLRCQERKNSKTAEQIENVLWERGVPHGV